MGIKDWFSRTGGALRAGEVADGQGPDYSLASEPESPEQMASMAELLADFSADFEGAELVNYVSAAVQSESLALMTEHDMGQEAAAALGQFAATLRAGGENAEIAAGTTSEVKLASSDSMAREVEALLKQKRDELGLAVAEYAGTPADPTRLRKETWIALGGLDQELQARFGEDDGLGSYVETDFGTLAARSGLAEHTVRPLGEVRLEAAEAFALKLEEGTQVLTNKQLAELEEAGLGGAAVQAEMRRIERPVYVFLSELDRSEIAKGSRVAERSAVLAAGPALMAAQTDGLASFAEADALIALYGDEEFQAHVAHGQVALMRENLEESMHAGSKLLAEHVVLGLDADEAEAEQALVAEIEAELAEERMAAVEREQIVSAEVEAEIEDEPDYEDDVFRSAVPIKRGPYAPEPYPSPALQRAKDDRQLGM